MLLELLRSTLIFLGLAFGLGWPLAARLRLAPVEKIAAAAALSLLGTFLFAWAVYVSALPAVTLWGLPLLAALGLIFSPRALWETCRDADARGLLAAQLLVTAWCVGWLALVVNYSGGGWAADWFEHWDRARFFLERSPRDLLFLGHYPLTARPPLANVLTAAFLQLTRADFAHYQVASTLFGSLAFLPAALLARRFGGSRAIALCAVLLMLSPLFVQNATFAWTKLPAAFFVLTALYFFLRTFDGNDYYAAAFLCSASLAAGLLAHYSAGPYAVLLAGAWFAVGRDRFHETAWRHATALAALAGALVLATWFAWALAVYGVNGTLLANSTATAADASAADQLWKILLNLRDTLVPHFLRPLDPGLIAQRSAWGHWRDWWFQLYQLNLLFAFGSVAWLAILFAAIRTPPARRVFWTVFVSGAVVLGISVHSGRDTWGLAHICLQPLALLGLAFLAARWPALPRAWRLALFAGAVLDFIVGLALHFAVQNYALDRWLTPTRSPADWLFSYNETATMNVNAKAVHSLQFFADVQPLPLPLVVAGLAVILVLALVRANRPRSAPR